MTRIEKLIKARQEALNALDNLNEKLEPFARSFEGLTGKKLIDSSVSERLHYSNLLIAIREDKDD